MPKKFKRIHMPPRLHEEIEKFVLEPNSPYKTVGALCSDAGRILIEQYKLKTR